MEPRKESDAQGVYVGETARGEVSSGEPQANRCWARGFGAFDYIRNGGRQLPQNPHLPWQQKLLHTKLLSPRPTVGLPLSSPQPPLRCPPLTHRHTHPLPGTAPPPHARGSTHPSLSTSNTELAPTGRPEAGHRTRPASGVSVFSQAHPVHTNTEKRTSPSLSALARLLLASSALCPASTRTTHLK